MGDCINEEIGSVFIVTGRVEYEFEEILGVFSSKEKANDYINAYYKTDKQKRTNYDWVNFVEWRIGEYINFIN